MHALVLGAALSLLVSSSAQAADLNIRERAPLLVALHLPVRQFASASEIVELADGAIRATTDFKLKLVPDAVTEACAAQGADAVACLARALKRDSRFLLMVSTIDEAHVVSVLVDLERADEILNERVERTDEETNKLVTTKAVISATLPTEVRDQTQLERYFTDFLGGELAPVFEQAGARTLGAVEIVLPSVSTAKISFDGNRVVSDKGTLSIRDVPPGPHVIKIDQDGYTTWETTIELEPLQIARVTPALQPTSVVVNRAFRQATLYGGLVVAATGIALSVASLFDDSAVCVGTDGCPGSYLRTTTLPIGYSLIGMGAAWSLGAWLGQEDSFPWIELLAGVVVSGVSYGVTWAAEPRCGACNDLVGR